ncbi:MAG: CDP-glucose 4,6-dehydratase, partial [Candidatus Latescibacteria bacterium]|nr:CDP-glucose 4,6-dehydratase [Candidatus Latescibacterota bacterium]
LVTGAAGFKGSWLAIALLDAGAGEVIGLDKERRPRSNFAMSGLDQVITYVQGDIRDQALLLRLMTEYQVDVVFHLAAQPIVKTAFRNPLETVGSNVMGTAFVLEAVRQAGTVSRCVVATSDKAYFDKGGELYTEDDRLQGNDIYSASKSAADILTSSWIRNYYEPGGIHCGIVRCGNIIGGGDWSKGRIVIDCVTALSEGRKPDIHNPDMVRDYFYVLDAVSGYLSLGAALDEKDISGNGFNFGPHEHDTKNSDLATRICELWDSDAGWQHTPPEEPFPEINKQTLSWDKSRDLLHWAPAYTLNEALQDTVTWYKGWGSEEPLDELNVDLLHRHRDRARSQGLQWADS